MLFASLKSLFCLSFSRFPDKAAAASTGKSRIQLTQLSKAFQAFEHVSNQD